MKSKSTSSGDGREPSEPFPQYTPPTKGITSCLPSSWIPFAELIRLDHPHGFYLVFFPHILGLIYASAANPSLVPLNILAHRIGMFVLWTFFMRGAGCAWNDIVDREFDRRTARCCSRPVARGAISAPVAGLFALALTTISFLTLQTLPKECTLVGLSTLALTVLYPYGKRFTHFPQVILGSTLASTVSIAAYSVGLPALSKEYIVPTFCLTASIVLLVIFYDVLYAKQDTADDIKSGVKGMAVRFRHHLSGLFSLLTLSIAFLLGLLGSLVGMGFFYYLFSVAGLAFGLITTVALTHWKIMPSLSVSSGWCYTSAIASLVTGFALEYSVHLGRLA